MAAHAGDWPWSSARAHLNGTIDVLAEPDARFAEVDDWAAFLHAGLKPGEAEALRASSRTGRPLGSAPFIEHLEQMLGRALGRRKPGPKLRTEAPEQPRLL